MAKPYLEALKEQAHKVGYRKLAEKTVSRQSLHNLFSEKDVRLSTLNMVAKRLGYEVDVRLLPARKQNLKRLRSALKKFGAPFYDNDSVELSAETTVLLALNYAAKDPTVSDVLPYVLALNADKIDWFHVLQNLPSGESRQLLGYFTELANAFKTNANLERALNILYRPDFPALDLTQKKSHGKYAQQLMARVVNPPAKKWNVLTFNRESDVLERYDKWQRLSS